MHTNKISSRTTFWICESTHKEEETLVFANGSTAAQEAQEKEHASHAEDDVDTSEQQGVSCYNFPESCGVHQHPHTHSQEERAPQLMEKKERKQLLDKAEIGCILKNLWELGGQLSILTGARNIQQDVT